ncbi:hypothetical protein E2C01_101838 [Portunus trituberculatus]|uniref:Uncharacterized protein n=1 Tax=Portunus trituberculatus TaxID=210409 RepID=A0A5B7KH10_PORTR|nr:hypothetical protein [Portunus trituberculatus]
MIPLSSQPASQPASLRFFAPNSTCLRASTGAADSSTGARKPESPSEEKEEELEELVVVVEEVLKEFGLVWLGKVRFRLAKGKLIHSAGHQLSQSLSFLLPYKNFCP